MKKLHLLRLLAATCVAIPVIVNAARADDAADLLLGGTKAATDTTTDAAARSRLLAPAVDATATQDQPAAAVKAGPDEVDLAALYYYAEQKQDDRVAAETARLRLKYPDFEVPKDLYAPRNQRIVDEASLWALYDKDDFTGIDAETKRLQLLNPGWLPSQDFASKLAHRKERVLMSNAYKAKDWLGLIQAAKAIDPAKDTEIDLLWMLVDGYREADMKDAQLAVYKGILFRDGDKRLPDGILVTTLQKATRDFSSDEIRAVMQTLWTNPALVADLQPVTLDLLRLDVASFNADETRTEPLPEKDIKRMQDLVASKHDTGDMSLLGWYHIKLKQPEEAEKYFTEALAKTPTAEFAKGLYLSLAQQGRDSDAYQVADQHLKEMSEDPEFLMSALSLRFGNPDLGEVDAAAVEGYSNAIMKTRSAPNAEILGWYAYNARQYDAAEAWFRKSWDWKQSPDRLKGIALSLQREGKRADLKALRDQYADQFPDVWNDIKVPVSRKTKDSQRKSVPIAKPSDLRKTSMNVNTRSGVASQWR